MFKVFSSRCFKSSVSLYFWNFFETKACTSVIHRHLFKDNFYLTKHQIITQNQFSLSHVTEDNFLQRFKKKVANIIPIHDKVAIAGVLVYEAIADTIDYDEFFHAFRLPDTFQSWFLAIQLHVWMCILVTFNKENGKSFRRSLVDTMWHDVELRTEKLVEMKSSRRKKYLKELNGQFRASLISYDEGILSNDAVLAASIWRTLFCFQLIDPELLENAVLYIRKQLHTLDTQSPESIILHGKVKFLPLKNILLEKNML